MSRALMWLLPLILVSATWPGSAIAADKDEEADTDAETSESEIWVQTDVEVPDNEELNSENEPATAGGTGTQPFYTAFQWRPACGNTITGTQGGQQPCASTFSCPPDTSPFRRFGLHEGTWYPLGLGCFAEPPTGDVTPTITPGMVLQAFQRIPLPRARSVAQPDAKTLVNFDTIFHTQADRFTRVITLLGQRVELDISPSTFAWSFGDGATITTKGPGSPYPAKEIVHRYLDAHVTVSHRVTVTWTARFRVNDGPWADVPGSVTRTGPATPIRIAEATPALSGEGH